MHPFFNSISRIMVLLIGWLLLAVSISSLNSVVSGAPLTDCLLLYVPLYFVGLLFILPNYYICKSLPLGPTPWLMLFATQLITLVVTAGMWMFAGTGLAWLLDSLLSPPRWGTLFTQGWYLNLAIYIIQFEVIMLLHYLVFALEKSRILEQAALKQRLLVSQAELQTLKATVHPHFLFNSLNTLANIALSAPEKAHRFCLLIAEFLRYSVAYSNKSSATLGEELEHIQNYLGIERERFGDRLRTQFEIDDSLSGVVVPALILFPLVENAIKHGINSCIDGGLLSILMRQTEGSLIIEVSNPVDELGRKLRGTGHGLDSVRQRLKTLYGESALLKTSRRDGGYTAILYIPMINPDLQEALL